MSARAWLSTRWCARAAISSDPHLIVHERTIKQAHKCNAPLHIARSPCMLFWIDQGPCVGGACLWFSEGCFLGCPNCSATMPSTGNQHNVSGHHSCVRPCSGCHCSYPCSPHFISHAVLHRCVQDVQAYVPLALSITPRRPEQCLAFAALASLGHPQMQLSYICSGPDLDLPALANRRRLFDIVVLLHISLFPCESVAALLVCASGHAWLPVATLDQDVFKSWPWLSACLHWPTSDTVGLVLALYASVVRVLALWALVVRMLALWALVVRVLAL